MQNSIVGCHRGVVSAFLQTGGGGSEALGLRKKELEKEN